MNTIKNIDKYLDEKSKPESIYIMDFGMILVTKTSNVRKSAKELEKSIISLIEKSGLGSHVQVNSHGWERDD